jgi:hypothetical protein
VTKRMQKPEKDLLKGTCMAPLLILQRWPELECDEETKVGDRLDAGVPVADRDAI